MVRKTKKQITTILLISFFFVWGASFAFATPPAGNDPTPPAGNVPAPPAPTPPAPTPPAGNDPTPPAGNDSTPIPAPPAPAPPASTPPASTPSPSPSPTPGSGGGGGGGGSGTLPAKIFYPQLSIKKSVRDINQNTPYQDMVFVLPGEDLSFKIEIELIGHDEAHNVIARDVLPEGIIYQGNLRVDNYNISGDISNIPLSIFVRKQTKIITFDAKVSPKDKFNPGLTTLTNRAYIKADNFTEISDPATVNVNTLAGEPVFSITKMAKNITKGDTEWKNEIAAEPGDTLQFQVQIINTKTTAISGVKLKDILNSKFAYSGNLLIDGIVANRDVGQDLILGVIAAGQTKTVTYEVKVAGENDFSYGPTEIINVADVFNNDFSLFATTKVVVTRKGVLGATSVVTGINVLYIALMAGFALAILLYFLLFYFDNSQNPYIRKVARFLGQLRLFMFR